MDDGPRTHIERGDALNFCRGHGHCLNKQFRDPRMSRQTNGFRHLLLLIQYVNLDIGCRFHYSGVCLHFRVYVIGVLCPVRISGRLGRVGPEFGLSTPIPNLPPWLVTRDCGDSGHFCVRFGVYKNIGTFGPFGSLCAGLHFGFGFSAKGPMCLNGGLPRKSETNRNLTRGSLRGPSKPYAPQILREFQI